MAKSATPTPEVMAEAVDDVRATLARTDTTAGSLLTLSTALLAGLVGAAAFVRPHLPEVVLVVAGLATGTLGGAVLYLLATVRPRAGGGYGPEHWADQPPKVIVSELAEVHPAIWRARELRALGGIVAVKHKRLRRAVDLLATAVLLYAAAAGLALAIG